MSKAINQEYLLTDQYRDAGKLNARMALHERFGTSPIQWHRWVFDQFDLPANARILELGCGPGTLWVQNADRIPSGWDITLSDLSPGMLDQARKNLDGIRPFSFEQCDAQDIPLADGVFDAIIANHMLYHVPDRPKAYAEVNRVLKPNGRFYAAANGRDNMRQISELGKTIGVEGSLRSFRTPEDSNHFDLDIGESELKVWFDTVSLSRKDETLAVTESQALVDYILSGAHSSQLTGKDVQTLKATIEADIVEHGAFRIEKIAGLFVASVTK